MSNSKINNHDLHEEVPEVKFIFTEEDMIPHAGYDLIFSEEMTAKIIEFVDSPLFKRLEKLYGLQKMDLIARQALNSADQVSYVQFLKGTANGVSLFFKDMRAVKDAWKKRSEAQESQEDAAEE